MKTRADSRTGARYVKQKKRTIAAEPTVGTPFVAQDSLVGLVVKASASRAEDPGFESRLRRDFFGVESYQ